MRVVTSDDNFHTILHANRANEVEVIEQTPIACKVNVKGMLSPVKFVVAFKTAGGEGKTTKSLR